MNPRNVNRQQGLPGKKKRPYLLRTILLILVSFPVALYIRIQWETAPDKYFKKRCDEIAGEKIYKTVKDVKGFLLARTRDKRDLYSRLRARDIPDDPYHHTNIESKHPEALYLSLSKKRYQYLEIKETGNRYSKYTLQLPDLIYNKKNTFKHSSKYAVKWEVASTKDDLKTGVHVGIISVFNLTTGDILATHTGLFLFNKRRDRYSYCPRGKTDQVVSGFVNKVLIPTTTPTK